MPLYILLAVKFILLLSLSLIPTFHLQYWKYASSVKVIFPLPDWHIYSVWRANSKKGNFGININKTDTFLMAHSLLSLWVGVVVDRCHSTASLKLPPKLNQPRNNTSLWVSKDRRDLNSNRDLSQSHATIKIDTSLARDLGGERSQPINYPNPGNSNLL